MKTTDVLAAPTRSFVPFQAGYLYMVTPILGGSVTAKGLVQSNLARLFEVHCSDVVVGYYLQLKKSATVQRADFNIVSGFREGAAPSREDALELIRIERRDIVELIFAFNTQMFSLMQPTTVNYVPQKEN